MILIAICEDNAIHLERLLSGIRELLDVPCRIDTFSSAEEFRASAHSAEASYDIVLMDIELGADSGISLSQEINLETPNAQIIFITQHAHYSSDVYDAEHLYFIDKGKLDFYLPKALEKARKNVQQLNNSYLTFSWNREVFQISQKDIIYMERMLRTTDIHTTTKVYRTSEKLVELMPRMNDAFTICHRSYIVNLRYLRGLEHNRALLTGDIEVPVSRNQYVMMKKALARFSLK